MKNIEVKVTTKMKQDLKRAAKRGKNLIKLNPIIEALSQHKKLPQRYNDHSLSGSWKGYRECHIEPDWLLVYCISKTVLQLARTGTHSDLFKK